MPNQEQELFDIYDESRQPTGATAVRGETRLVAGQYQMYVTVIVRDTEGRFLITQRALDKGWGAGWWEVTGGGVRTGETVEEALQREVAEEVGLDASRGTCTLISAYANVDAEGGDNYFMNIYQCDLDFTLSDVTLQAEEAIDCRLATWDDIVALNKQGVFLHFQRIADALGK